MTDKLFSEIWADAQQINDIDAFSSDWALSSALLPDGAETDPVLCKQLRTLWHVAHDSFKELLQLLGLRQTGCATRFCIPLRTVQGWALGERECPPYIRLMMAEAMGVLALRDSQQVRYAAIGATEYDKLLDFVTNDLNENNRHDNAVCYDEEWRETCMDMKVVFVRDNAELYKRLLQFCIDNGLVVMATRPGTYTSIIRVSTKAD